MLHASPPLSHFLDDPDPTYPDGDGKPLADSTLQLQWIFYLVGNLDAALPDFVAGDLLWYPVRGQPKTRLAPDAMVVLGRPKGHRRSYRQWLEDGVAPAVVFEVLSECNTFDQMLSKGLFYSRHGAQEFYIYDPDKNRFWALDLKKGSTHELRVGESRKSAILGVTFRRGKSALEAFDANGSRFLRFDELKARADALDHRLVAEIQRAEAEARKAEAEAQRAEAQAQRADAAEERVRALEARLRALENTDGS